MIGLRLLQLLELLTSSGNASAGQFVTNIHWVSSFSAFKLCFWLLGCLRVLATVLPAFAKWTSAAVQVTQPASEERHHNCAYS